MSVIFPEEIKMNPSNIFPILINLLSLNYILFRVCTFFVPASSSTVSDFYSSCTNHFNCGDITHVGFPFWGDERPAGCGHPALKLACERNKATIVIKEIKYQILNFRVDTNDSQTLTIARADYMDDLCPNKFINTTIDYNLFNTTKTPGYRNITLVYCSSWTGPIGPQFSCPDYKFGFIDVDALGPGPCNASVIVPVYFDSFTSVSDVVTSAEVLKAIQEGFEVRLNGDGHGCRICEESGGVCGYDSTSNRMTCYCRQGAYGDNRACRSLQAGGGPASSPGDGNKKVNLVIGVCVGLGLVVALFCIMIIYIHRRRRRVSSNNTLLTSKTKRMDIESIINYGPKRYQYSEIKKMSNSFSEKIGEGGYGTVYKGKLVDGTVVAIKVLKVLKGNGEEFINEVVSISRTAHVNIVSLLGFSYYNSKKIALVYEFMANGSVDRFMSTSRNVEMNMLHRIVIGVGRGLEYLHCGCSTRIVHFDIKPQNILLDEDYNPKISDFGLAKLCKGKESAISMLGTRGTAGFIAPEVFSRAFGIVSYKSDVYSYGMLVLDLVLGGIRNNPNSNLLSDDESEMYFPNWVFKKFEMGKIKMDLSLMEQEEEMEMKMVMVGLWCIQTSPLDRPSMSRVLEMLEGSIHSLQMPPKPSLVPPKRSTQKSTSQSISYEFV